MGLLFFLNFELIHSVLSSIIFFVLHVTSPNLFPKPLSKKEEEKLIDLMTKGDLNAKNKLVEHNLRLVAHITKKYSASKEEPDDLISIGTIGLIKAINTFNKNKGIKLSSYASRCIENEILMNFRSSKKTQLDVSMNEPIETDKNGNALTIMDTIASDECVFDKISNKIDVEKLTKLINTHLTPREKIIMHLRYGLNGTRSMPQREVANKLKISRSYVSRIEKKAIAMLKSKF